MAEAGTVTTKLKVDPTAFTPEMKKAATQMQQFSTKVEGGSRSVVDLARSFSGLRKDGVAALGGVAFEAGNMSRLLQGLGSNATVAASKWGAALRIIGTAAPWLLAISLIVQITTELVTMFTENEEGLKNLDEQIKALDARIAEHDRVWKEMIDDNISSQEDFTRKMIDGLDKQHGEQRERTIDFIRQQTLSLKNQFEADGRLRFSEAKRIEGLENALTDKLKAIGDKRIADAEAAAKKRQAALLESIASTAEVADRIKADMELDLKILQEEIESAERVKEQRQEAKDEAKRLKEEEERKKTFDYLTDLKRKLTETEASAVNVGRAFSNAAGAGLADFLNTIIAGKGALAAFQAFTRGLLNALAQQAVVKAAAALAEGLFQLAWGNVASAKLFFASAAKWSGVALMAGGLAAAVGGGGGGAGGGGIGTGASGAAAFGSTGGGGGSASGQDNRPQIFEVHVRLGESEFGRGVISSINAVEREEGRRTFAREGA